MIRKKVKVCNILHRFSKNYKTKFPENKTSIKSNLRGFRKPLNFLESLTEFQLKLTKKAFHENNPKQIRVASQLQGFF